MKTVEPICSYARLSEELRKRTDAEYKAFNEKIVNSSYKTLGVRTPDMRAIAKAVPLDCRDKVLSDFFAQDEHFYEDVCVAGYLAARKGDYERTREYIKKLIPLFGSWAHVDTVIPSLDWVDRDIILSDFEYLLDCDGQYEVRSYVIMLFDCLTDERIDFVLDKIKTVRTGEYYIDMALAWLLSECLVKYYDEALPLVESKTLPVFVHNKAIQKARESYRLSADKKAYLATLKIRRDR